MQSLTSQKSAGASVDDAVFVSAQIVEANGVVTPDVDPLITFSISEPV